MMIQLRWLRGKLCFRLATAGRAWITSPSEPSRITSMRNIGLLRGLLAQAYVLDELLQTLRVFRFQTSLSRDPLGDEVDASQPCHQLRARGIRQNRIVRRRNHNDQRPSTDFQPRQTLRVRQGKWIKIPADRHCSVDSASRIGANNFRSSVQLSISAVPAPSALLSPPKPASCSDGQSGTPASNKGCIPRFRESRAPADRWAR